jgi:hypothetical protein
MSGLVPRLSQQELNKKRNIIYQDQTAYPDESLGTNFIHPLNAAKLIAYKRVARQQREALIRRITAGHKVFKKRKSFKKERKSKKRKAKEIKSKKNHKIDSKKNKHKSQ